MRRMIPKDTKHVPVQAYIPRGVYRRFKAMYPAHGAISKLIRQAFRLAIEEDEQLEEMARHQLDGPGLDKPAESG